MAPPPTLTVRRKLLFGVVVTLMAVMVMELLLRGVLGPPPPATQVFEALNDWDKPFLEEGGRVSKTYEVPSVATIPPFPAKVDGPRVAVIGESSVHGGSPVPTAQEFPDLLGVKLGVPVVNLATPGLDSFDLLKIVEHMAPYDFSVLVIYTGHNDTGNTWFDRRYGTLGSGLALRTRVVLDQLYLFGGLRRALAKPEGTNRGGSSDYTISTLQRAEAARMFKLNLERMVWLAHKRGMAVVLAPPVCRLVFPPHAEFCDDDGVCAKATYDKALSLMGSDKDEAIRLFELARDLDGKPLRAPSAIVTAMRDVAAEHKTWLVDMPHAVPQSANLAVPDDQLFADFIHLSAYGHLAFANALEPAVREAVAATK